MCRFHLYPIGKNLQTWASSCKGDLEMFFFYISCNIPIWKCVAVALQKKMDIEEIFKVDIKENLAETAILQSCFLPVSHKDPSLLSDLKLKSHFCFF